MEKHNLHYSAMEIEIHNGFLETLLSRSVCPGWNWSLYAKPDESGSGNNRYFVRMDHPGNRETDDIEFDPEKPVISFLENCRGLYEDYHSDYEELGIARDSMEAARELYNALCRTMEFL